MIVLTERFSASQNPPMMRVHFRALRFLPFLFLFFVTVVRSADHPSEAIRAMVDAERKFYETGQEKGTRAAFLTFLADDGIVFRPGPVNGKDVWSKRPETGLDLIWEPVFAAVARSGDLDTPLVPRNGRRVRMTRSHKATVTSFPFGKNSPTARGK